MEAGRGGDSPVMESRGGICVCLARVDGPWAGLEPLSAIKNGSGPAEVGPAARDHVRHARTNRQLEAAQHGSSAAPEDRNPGRVFPDLALPQRGYPGLAGDRLSIPGVS